MTPLERAAKALEDWVDTTPCIEANPECPGGLYCAPNRKEAVRAVLTAIREPSKAMRDAGIQADLNDDEAVDIYRAMIDVMLEEG